MDEEEARGKINKEQGYGIELQINSATLKSNELIKSKEATRTLHMAEGHFELFFSSGDFVTRSTPTDGWIAVIPCIQAVGDTPEGTFIKMIDRDTGEVIVNESLRTFRDGEKHTFMYESNNGKYPFPFMPDHNWHLRVQMEYPEENTYTSKEVTIVNGSRSGLESKCEVIKPTLPPEFVPGEKLTIPYSMKNIGDEVGLVGLCGYVTPNWRQALMVIPLPTHPEFNSKGISTSFRMPRYHEYLRWVGYSYSQSIGQYIQDSMEEHTILCTDPATCDCPGCDTEHGCYNHSYHNGTNPEYQCCFWDITKCEIPDKFCKPYLSEHQDHRDDLSTGLPEYDERFDYNMDDRITWDDLMVANGYSNSKPPESQKIWWNCNPDVDRYSTEIKNWWKADMKFDPDIVNHQIKAIPGPMEVNREIVLVTRGWHVTNNIDKEGGCASDIAQISIDEIDSEGNVIKTIASYQTTERLPKGRHEISNDLLNTVIFSRQYEIGEILYLAINVWGKYTENEPPFLHFKTYIVK